MSESRQPSGRPGVAMILRVVVENLFFLLMRPRFSLAAWRAALPPAPLSAPPDLQRLLRFAAVLRALPASCEPLASLTDSTGLVRRPPVTWTPFSLPQAHSGLPVPRMRPEREEN